MREIHHSRGVGTGENGLKAGVIIRMVRVPTIKLKNNNKSESEEVIS